MSKPSSSVGQGKQATLFGFFTKKPKEEQRPAPSKVPPTPATPAASEASNAGSSADRSSSSNRQDRVAPSSGLKQRVPASGKANKSSKSDLLPSEPIDLDLDLENDFDSETEAVEEAKPQSKPNSTLHTREGPSPSIVAPTPPLTSEAEDAGNSSSALSEMELDDVEDEDAEEPNRTKRVRKAAKKRQIVLSDNDDSDASEAYGDSPPPFKKTKSATAASKTSGKKSTKKSANDSDFSMGSGEEDSDEFGDDGVDWAQVAAMSDSSDTLVNRKSTQAPNKSSNKQSKLGNGVGKASASASKASGKPNGRQPISSDTKSVKLNENYKQILKEQEEKTSEYFSFLLEDKIMDADRRRPDDPDFDQRTLYIPKKEYENLTPFEKQFWDIKKNHMDTVLFFQKGKFFELYEGDADIANQVFDLKLTGRVKMRMAGVPEASIDYWIAKFLGQGYKVGRVEQAETALGADLRRQDEKSGKIQAIEEGKGPKVVQRELKQVLTTGTIVDGSLLTDDLSNHCIAIKEYNQEGMTEHGEDHPPRFGIVIGDCSTAEFSITGFEDDACRTKLETTIRQHRPRELIHVQGNLSVPTLRLLRACVGPSCSWNSLPASLDILAPGKAITSLQELFGGASTELSGSDEDIQPLDEQNLRHGSVPQAIRDMYTNLEAMSAAGAMLWYLKGLNLEKDLFNVRNFNIFDPIRDGKALILDGQTLAHIEILQNSLGTDEGTLFKLMCRCNTPFGKRLFKIWVCQPLLEADAINDRLDAVEDIMSRSSNSSSPFESIFDKLTKNTPDVERLLSRIHAGSCKVQDFAKVVKCLENLPDLFEKLQEASSEFKSSVIRTSLKSIPDIKPLVDSIKQMYNIENDVLMPKAGGDEEYDAWEEKVTSIENSLRSQLKLYRKELSSQDIQFKDIGTKDIYQIEVPVKIKAPKNWSKISSTKAVNRYYSPEVEKLVRKLKEARERKDQAVKAFTGKLYAAFSQDYRAYMQAVRLVAEIDCLVSLAKTSAALGEPAVRPQIVDSARAAIEFEELRHPCVFSATSDFIPNDVIIGGQTPNMVLLTGPNMAGKSTLLRMTCVGVIMAQIGCFVPATSAKISPCDKIVSRMGASDNMLAGQSTFRVEMEDCRKILVESTPKTLVILDELGRGTSTFDGLSIAYSVLHQLAGHLGCIGFFATHFTSLVDDFARHPEIVLKHMKSMVDEDTREVTFLYRLTDGCSPKSYGPHVASMAGVPRNIVEKAIDVSKHFEDRTKAHESSKKENQAVPLDLQADAAYLMKLIAAGQVSYSPELLANLSIIRKKIAVEI